MKQNNYFSLKRFKNLLRNDWLINQKTYLFTLVGIALAIYGLCYFLMRTSGHFTNSQYLGLFIFYMIGNGIIIGTSFPVLTDHVKTINYILTPASIIEKYMVQFLNRIVIFIPLALLIFWVAVHLAKASLLKDQAIGFDLVNRIDDFHYKGLVNQLYYKDLVPSLLGIFSYYTFLFAGSVYYNRYALAKSIILTGAILFSVYLFLLLFSHLVFPEQTKGFNVYFYVYNVTKDIDNIKFFLYTIASLSWLFFLPLAYFKLKEKEV